MMKRMFILLVLISLILIPAMAANGDSLSSDEFEIKGYKITDSSSVEFIITDAISESLNTFSKDDLEEGSTTIGRVIDATSQIGSFLNDTADINEEDADNIIFSYRLVASDDLTYTINFSITPFKNGDNIIDAAFRTAHHNTVYSDGTQLSGFDFPQANAGSTADGNPSDAGSTANGNLSDTEDPSTNRDHKNAVLEDSIKPKEGNSSQWIFRGAVLMAVSRRDFDRAPTGMYRSTVTATLTTD